jgi:hypothetical protein
MRQLPHLKQMTRLDRKYWVIRQVSRVLILTLSFQVLYPLQSKALTSGPTQPEVMQFQQAGVSGMVDPFSGGFNYSIPLLELPGPNGSYPFTLGYQSGVTMDQEASWVGLGWSLNPGAITRSMRGLPDEFDGDAVMIEQHMKKDWTVGVSGGLDFELFGGDAGLNTGLSLYYNSYRGIGYTLDAGFQTGFGNAMSAGAGLNLSLDNQDGINVSPRLSFGHRGKRTNLDFAVGMGYNSRRGMTDLTFSASASQRIATSTSAGGRKDGGAGAISYRSSSSIGGSSKLYSASTAYTPIVDKEMSGGALNLRVRTGISLLGADPNLELTGFYNYNDLAWTERDIPAYGYLNMHRAPDHAMTDMNRENDGMIRKETPNLAIPMLTNDVYQFSGHGTGGVFRAWRNEVGVVGNRKAVSTSSNFGAGIELNPTKFAGDVSAGLSESESGVWENRNDVLNSTSPYTYGFHGKDGHREDYEPWYFKMEGDLSTDPTNDLSYLNGTGPIRLGINDLDDPDGRKIGRLQASLEDKNGTLISGLTPLESYATDPNRRSRNVVIDYVTIKDIKTNPTGFGEYKITHFNHLTPGVFQPNHQLPTVALDRARPDHHFAGMSVQQPDGARYVYGLPAYNKKQVENVFSADGDNHDCDKRIDVDYNSSTGKVNHMVAETDEYLHRTETPEYAHSYLLTSVLGTDYIDADAIPGPSDGDLGFWVKFNYVKTSDNFKWRAPFVGANFSKGQRSTRDDDKASYMYGEREEWYLASAETKTHVVEFELDTRPDNRGAKAELQNLSSNLGDFMQGYSYHLKTVSLYSKLELAQPGTPSPIVKVTLTHNWDLCQGVYNSSNYGGSTDTGKLTLESVTFAYRDSDRNSSYQFAYGNNTSDNPPYNPIAQDKWGNYRPVADECVAAYTPYTDQTETRSVLDAQNSVWHLKEITLPTGGEMTIQYEANDYAYVQNKPAMEMYRLKGTRVGGQWSGQIYDDYKAANPSSRAQQRKLYVDLGRTITTTAEADAIMKNIDQVYIKGLIKLRKPTEGFEEYVTAYLKVHSYQPYVPSGQTLAQGTDILEVELAESDWNAPKNQDYHPLAVAAWTYLRSNLPQLMSIPGSASLSGDPGTAASAIRQRMLSLFSIGPEIVRIFSGFSDYAEARDWGSVIIPEESWIRLNHLEKSKVGGGCRVKKISLNDNFGQMATGGQTVETGVVYDYTMMEDGKRISAGVTAYEPMIGGDENPLRYAKRYPAAVPLMSPYSLFMEMPVNENYMPAAVLGYRQVTVRSLASQKVLDNQLAATVPTTGAAVHEFWTAKDFPVISDETQAHINPFKLTIPVPFVGYFAWDDMTATQGYSIELNDMHGKVKRVSNYGIDQHGDVIAAPINWVEYEYADAVVAPGTAKERRHLSNNVYAMLGDVDPTDGTKSWIQEKSIGMEHEFFVDMREYNANNGGIGLATNADFAILGYIPSVWPNITYAKSRVRTAVTNKIVHRSGILTGTRAYNQGSLVETSNLLFDAQTGRPLLTRVTNNYNAPVYTYDHPAFWAYDQMGPAYKNIGVAFTAPTVTQFAPGVYGAAGFGTGTAYEDLLVPGDELMVSTSSGGLGKAIYLGAVGTNAIFSSKVNLVGSNRGFRVQRSGRRNMLGVDAEQIISLRNPTVNRGNQMCWRDITNPMAVVETTWVTTTVVSDTTLAPCMENVAWILNSFFQNTASTTPNTYQYPSASPLFGCGNCEVQSIMQNHNEITIECSIWSCTLTIVDDANQPIEVPDIDHIEGIAFDGTPVVPISGSLPYGISMQVYLVGNSTPVTGWFTGCEEIFGNGLNIVDTEVNEYHSTFTGTPSTDILETEMFMVDSVLRATATTFSDTWMNDFADVRFPAGSNAAQLLTDLEASLPFANGQRGIWRPKDSYVYVTDRRQSTEVNTGKDGTFSGVPMFDFQSITFSDCAENWRKVNEVTRYSPYGVELENRDILNVYSSALYGYNGKLPIAVGNNADYQEMGFESFEEYTAGSSVNVLSLSTGNLDFPTVLNVSSPNVWSYADILYGEANQFFLSATATNAMLINPVLTSGVTGRIMGRTHGSVFAPSIPYGEKHTVTINTPQTEMVTVQAPYLHHNTDPNPHYAGRVSYQRPALSASLGSVNNAAYTDDKAHTGKVAIEVTGKADFPQNRLKLAEGEQYTIQLWTSRANTDVHTYAQQPAGTGLGVRITFYDETGSPVGTNVDFSPSGELVEGWQKIEGNFTIPASAENIMIRLRSGGPLAYFDDIRIQPLKSKMKCHVYDPNSYRLLATLDDDNFAMVYHYDEAGQLYLVQKETVEGLRTIQESRSFLAE